MQMQIIIVDNDATACFDQMIKAPNNLACLQHGADPKYIQLHAQTQQALKYHLKHKYGISSEYNTNSNNTPWYGMGQGAGDASNWWVIGTDSMLDACSEKAHGWIVPSPTPHNLLKQTLKAFIDDVNLFIGQQPNTTEPTFLAQAQDNINRWHGLLQATGGELNPKKCFWANINFNFDKNGTPHIHQCQPQDPQLFFRNTDGSLAPLRSIKPHGSNRHLGVNISIDGNHKTKMRVLLQ